MIPNKKKQKKIYETYHKLKPKGKERKQHQNFETKKNTKNNKKNLTFHHFE